MIEIKNLNKYYNKHKKNEIHVINNTTLSLSNTGLVALLGNSGCGKTTLLNAIGGLDKANSGEIFVNGKRITNKSRNYIDKIRCLNIGYIFQDHYLVDDMSVFDNIALVLKINGIKDKNEIKKRVNFVLEKTHMYRYRNRPCSMLSGGERARVSIARAIVKNPSIIIADEPTGNLDSKNSLEIMNIIKAISKDRLVILVTHETKLADFYASRIIKIEDGKVISDEENNKTDTLDYKVDNNIYLKDFEKTYTVNYENTNIKFYGKTDSTLDISIVVKDGNIYIKSNDNKKIETVDQDSSIEFIDDNYKELSKSIYEEYNFDFDKIINKNIKEKYSSIYNLPRLIHNGFKKVFNYSGLKKVLLLGFFFTSLIVSYCIYSVFGLLDVKEEKFVKTNKNYIVVNSSKNSMKELLELSSLDSVYYVIVGNSKIQLIDTYENEYYQTRGANSLLNGSLSSLNMINKSDILLGKYPERENEIIIDKIVALNYLKSSSPTYIGIKTFDDLLNRTVYSDTINSFKIVGIVDKQSPSIYMNEKNFVNVLHNAGAEEYDSYYRDRVENTIIDYETIKDDIKLVKGNYPINDYEVIIDEIYKETNKLDKEIDYKVNDKKLKVVGYYTSNKYKEKMLVSNNTVYYDLISSSKDYVIYPKDENTLLEVLNNKNKAYKKSYEYDKNMYMKSIEDDVTGSLIEMLIVIIISLVEIYLIIRGSFLSRIKEVGIYRAIGMKKIDIYKLFSGEIFAINLLTCLPGIILMTYCLQKVSDGNIGDFLINPYTFIVCIMVICIFNLVAGLLPVINICRKVPARILNRNDA